MSARVTLPAVAPRGKDFAVSHMSHVAGGTAKRPSVVVLGGRWKNRDDALAAASRIDERLVPVVIVVDAPGRRA